MKSTCVIRPSNFKGLFGLPIFSSEKPATIQKQEKLYSIKVGRHKLN